MLFGADRALEFAWLPAVPQGAVTATYSIDGDRHEIGGRLAGLPLQAIEQARDEGLIAAAPHLREALDLT